ncbi:divergent polysaccharide deacetylase family protein [Yoonia litorea]|uniref:Uncharacterized conserved protein YibQ, putative polysaccharide deacetylase 2 family n=1 Tax=Yoonia litorea TaxID=1123755 RepID=A0A1I6MAB2_9RHOB|nr:divergent polysaccharide deacetylase family protein [Yoonia litorea]SFS12591.1 Uncharacterized conserved protein YibQ, putative polysaccharide deacetylase 2 family [Yoonia litorea]
MLGYIRGAIWGVLICGTAVAAYSYLSGPLATPQIADSTGETNSDIGLVVLDTAFVPPSEGSLPRTPMEARPPFIDLWVPVLSNTARRPELPLVDGDSAIDAAPSPEVIVLGEAPEALPEVDTAEAPVVAPAEAPATVTPEQDGTQAAASEETESAPAAPSVRINRPGSEDTEEEAVAGIAAEVVEEPQIADDAPALVRHGAVFENPQNLPVMAILLVDRGEGVGLASGLADLGFAPTVVVNALSANSATQMRDFRTAGAEVAMELALPQGARPEDVEVAFAAALELMPQSAMLYSSGNDVVQGDRQVTAQVMEVLSANGMGFVAKERGLGGAIRSAGQAGVPAVAIMRELGGNGMSANAMGRALDQAAFRARQSGDAVLVADLNQQTLEALQAWVAENPDVGAVVGPVSAILRD